MFGGKKAKRKDEQIKHLKNVIAKLVNQSKPDEIGAMRRLLKQKDEQIIRLERKLENCRSTIDVLGGLLIRTAKCLVIAEY